MTKTRLGYSGGVTEAAIAYKETKETMKKAGKSTSCRLYKLCVSILRKVVNEQCSVKRER